MIKRSINYSLIFITIACAILMLGYYIFNVNKGYNLLDEGFYLLSGANPADTHEQLSSFNSYLHVFMIFSKNIIFLRLSMLILNTASIFLLAFACTKIIPGKSVSEKRATLLLMVASMITISAIAFMFPAEPNYNTLTVLGSTIYSSLLILLFTADRTRHNNMQLFLLGFVAIFVFFNKFSTGLILIFLAFIAYSLNSIKIRHFSLRGLLSLIAGLSCHLFIYFSLLQSWPLFLSSYKAGLLSMKILQSNHNILNLLQLYCQQFQDLLKFTYNRYQFIIYTFVIILLLRPISLFSRLWILRGIISYGMLITFLVLSYSIGNYWESEHSIRLSSFYLFGLLLMCLVWLTYFNFKQLKKPNFKNMIHCLLFIMLFLLPFIVALGTNNAIYTQILLSCFAWMPIYIFFSLLNSKVIGKTFTYFGVAGISILSLHYAIYSLKEMPYGLYGNLSAQKQLTTVNDTELYLDQTSKYIIDNTRNQLEKCGFKANDYLISLTDVPGLTYAVKARSPACPWYFGIYPGSKEFAKFCLSLSENHNAFVLLDSYNGQIPDFSENKLGEYFKDFSKKYIQCGEIKNISVKGGTCCKVPISNIKIFKLRENTAP